MKGNTKLLGFGVEPRKDDPTVKDPIVLLGRWGAKVSVVLPNESVDAIRKACTDLLPIRPLTPRMTRDYVVDYDEDLGRVTAWFSPLVAKQLAELLRAGGANVKEENAKLAETCAGMLEEAYEAHMAYTSTEGEPGVPQ